MLPFFGEREEAWLSGRHGDIAKDCAARLWPAPFRGAVRLPSLAVDVH